MNDLRYAIRMLLKQPGFSAVAVLTLALGIGANTAIFSVVDGVLLRPLPYPEADRLVMLWERNPQRGFEQEKVSGPDFLDWREQNRVFESMAFWPGWLGSEDFNLLNSEGVEKVKAVYAPSSLFSVLGIKPQLGRTFLPEEDLWHGNRVAVLSHELWQHRFGSDPNVIGQTLTVDTYGRRDYTIVGVMPPGFRFPSSCDLWLPAGWMGVRLDERRSAHWHAVIARLKPGVTLEQAGAEMNAIQARIGQEHPNDLIGSQVAVVPLLEQTLGRNLRLALGVLWGVVACVLLIACVNVANLLLARAAARQKEIAVRVTLGASRWRIARQLLGESLLLALLAGGLGTLLAKASLQMLVAIGSNHIPRLQEVSLNGGSLGFTLLISLWAGVLFGLAPAWQCSMPRLNDTLKESGRSATESVHRSRLRGWLVVSEIAACFVLLIGAGLMTRSFLRLTQINRGFQPDHLLTAQLDFSVSGFTTWIQPTSTRPQVTLREVIERLRIQPGVRSVGAVSVLPETIGGARTQTIVIENRPPVTAGEYPTANFQGVTPDYFRTMGIPLLRGRPFAESDAYEAPWVVIINETMAKRFFPNENPIGRRLEMGGRKNPGLPDPNDPSHRPTWKEIVGVVADMKKLSLGAETVPDIYLPYWQWPMQSPTLVVRTTTEPDRVSATIRSEVKTVNQYLPAPMIRTMDEILWDKVSQPRLQTLLLSLFALVALALAAVGTYGVIAYSAAQRTHEIGIRMALGAQQRNVLSLVIGQGMKLALAGVGIGVVTALALTRVMRNLLYEVTPTDPLTFATVSLLLLGIALFACWLPARRAARVDPMEALRYE